MLQEGVPRSSDFPEPQVLNYFSSRSPSPLTTLYLLHSPAPGRHPLLPPGDQKALWIPGSSAVQVPAGPAVTWTPGCVWSVDKAPAARGLLVAKQRQSSYCKGSALRRQTRRPWVPTTLASQPSGALTRRPLPLYPGEEAGACPVGGWHPGGRR